MKSLKPCPFCGGEAHIKEVVSVCGNLYTVGCSDSECMGHETWLQKSTVDEAVAAWNRRAERTCHIEMPVIDWETGETDYVCSACGFSADPQDWAETYDYCPRCGSRVVAADADR